MKAPLFLLAASACALLGLGACQDDPKRPPVSEGGSITPGTSGGGGGSDGGPADGGNTGDQPCTDLENSTDFVEQLAVLDGVPAGTGGQITVGTYDLSEARLYLGVGAGTPGLTGTNFRGSLRVNADGTTIERVMVVSTDRVDGGAEASSAVLGTISPSGVNATITLSCPTAGTENITYTALSNSLTLSNLTTKESFVYTKQP